MAVVEPWIDAKPTARSVAVASVAVAPDDALVLVADAPAETSTAPCPDISIADTAAATEEEKFAVIDVTDELRTEYHISILELCPDDNIGLPVGIACQVFDPLDESEIEDTEMVAPVYMAMPRTTRFPAVAEMVTARVVAAVVSVPPASCTNAAATVDLRGGQ
jgi:hypothetical protein